MKKTYLFFAIAILVVVGGCNNASDKGGPSGAVGQPQAADMSTPDGMTLIASNDCGTCHSVDTKIVGPSFKDIAAKYPNTPENVSQLAAKVVAGGSGVWGSTPMAGHPALAKADAEKMIGYIMSTGGKK